MGVVVLLTIAFLTGSVGARIAGRSRIGCLGSIVLGFIGAVLGRMIADAAELPRFYEVTVGGERFPIVWAVAGSALFVAVLGLLGGRGGKD
ncbi:hypothetical protein L6R50_05400 [Myxococcota bacterium]|nr:hypothetical protein [Myxococcota bacterium]